MKKNKNKHILCLAAAALLLTAGLTVGDALAYFTSYTTASGGVELDLGFTKTVPQEEVVNGKKEITIQNTGDFDCYVRVKALTGDVYKDGIHYSEPDGAGKWTPGSDGYYYYSDIVAAGGTTGQLDVIIDSIKTEVPKEDDQQTFNVIIIQECTPVYFDEDGKAYADWDAVADVSSDTLEEGEDDV